MENRTIFITKFDMDRLRALIDEQKRKDQRGNEYLNQLEKELMRANLTSSTDIPPDVITMNSKVRILDVETDEEMVFTLVFPAEADLKQEKLSVLAPIGTAILGFKTGDVINWNVPDGIRKIKVVEVIYQPEASGDYHL
jgi:regulator of nucleoside diphosphate kinase